MHLLGERSVLNTGLSPSAHSMQKMHVNKDQFSGERTKVVSFKSMEAFKLRLLTSKVFVGS